LNGRSVFDVMMQLAFLMKFVWNRKIVYVVIRSSVVSFKLGAIIDMLMKMMLLVRLIG